MPSENNNANQIFINGEEVINLRNDTVSSENLLQGETAHNKAGESITGDLDPATKDDAYLVSDIEDEIADDDYIPFNDVSDPDIIKKKTLFSSIVTKIKTAFNSVFASITGNNITDKKTFRENIQTIEFLGIDIPDNADLDTYTIAGNYRVVSDASGATIDNLPLAVCGKVIVFDNGNSGIEQFYFANHSPRIFVRTKFGSDAWTNWLELGSGGGSSNPHTYQTGTIIPANSDINTYMTEGVYSTGGNHSTISNLPTNNLGNSSEGKLIVSITNIGTRNAVRQIFNDRYIRIHNGTSWADWFTVAYAENTYQLDGSSTSKIIEENDDLNNLSKFVYDCGTFECKSSLVAESLLHCPVTKPFKMVVDMGLSGVRQTITITGDIDELDESIWTRVWNEGLQVHVFSDWVKIATKNDLIPHTYELGTEIPANSDLDTYTTVGSYYIKTDANASTISNMPEDYAGKIIVIATTDANTYRRQVYIKNYSNHTWIRSYNPNGSSWSDWYKLVTENEIVQFLGTAIPANADLNSYNNTKIGVWYCELNATAQTISNVPKSIAFKLIVMKARNNNNIIQYFLGYNTSCIYYRSTDDNGATWTRWVTVGQEVLNQYTAVEIISGNLNSYTTDGTYFWGSGNVSNISNAPFNDSGFMWVMRIFGTQYIRQVAFHRANNNILTRISTDSGSTWTSWGLLYNSVTNSPVTASQIQTGTDTTVRTVRADTLHNGILDTMASATQGVKRVSKIKVFHFSVPDNSGYYKWVKIFDITEWYNSTTTNQSTRSMSGFVFSDRDNGYMKQEYAWIDLGVAYEKVASQNAGALNLLTTNSNYKPQIIYESSTSKYFLCIRVAGAGRHLEFIGTMYDLTSYNTNLINEWILGTSDNQLPSGYSLAIDGSTHQERSCYGVCYTAGDQRIKTVDLADPMFKLEVGVMVGVRFTHTNTYSSTTDNPIQLNVNDTGAKNIWYSSSHTGSVSTGTNTNVYGYADRYIYYMYDGTYWVWMGSSVEIDTNDHINSKGDVTAETGTTRPAISGLSMSQAYNNGYPESYGNVMTMKGRGDSQLFIPWSGTNGKAEPLYFRSKRDSPSAEWSSWDKVFSRFFPQVGYAYCTTAETTLAKTCSLITGTWTQYNNSVAIVCFQYNVPADSTLNINGMGAKPIKFRGSNIANIIKAGDIALLVYIADTFRLVATDRPSGLFANYRYTDATGTPSSFYITYQSSDILITELSIVAKGDIAEVNMGLVFPTAKTYSTNTELFDLVYKPYKTLYFQAFQWNGNSKLEFYLENNGKCYIRVNDTIVTNRTYYANFTYIKQ